MTDYKEATVAGKTWRRCHRVLCENPLGGQPAVNYAMQDVMQLGDGEHITRDAGLFIATLEPGTQGKTYPLLDPATGETVGEMTEGQLFAALHSHFLYVARARDAELEAVQDRLREQAEAAAGDAADATPV